MTETKSFQVSFPIEGNRETFTSSGKPEGNFRETTSLKALADKVLQGNNKETLGKLSVSEGGNFTEPVSKVENSVSAADMAIMKAEYAALNEWLASRDMIDRNAAAYRDIILQIKDLDKLMFANKVAAFKTQARHVRYTYHIAETTNLNNPKEGHNHVQNNKAADR